MYIYFYTGKIIYVHYRHLKANLATRIRTATDNKKNVDNYSCALKAIDN